jgi:hypothetical protein
MPAPDDMEVAVLKSQLHEMRGNLTVVLGAIEMNQPRMAKAAALALQKQIDILGQMMVTLDHFMARAEES